MPSMPPVVEPPTRPPSRPSFGARILGAFLLCWSLGLVSCQSFFFL